MRLNLALLLALTLSMPLAMADQNIQQGPVAIQTFNYDNGSGCGGANGQHQRHAEATVEYYDDEKVGVWFDQTCSDSTTSTSEYRSRAGSLAVGRRVDDYNHGPTVAVTWMDWYERYDEWNWEARNCFTSVIVLGAAFQVGCLPADAQWPLVPTLP